MSQLIEHTGQVAAVNGNILSVRIEQLSACAGCHAKGICSVSDSAEKLVEVYTDRTDFSVGESVLLLGQSSLGLKAVLVAYVVPFLLILAVLFVLNTFVANEAVSGSLALAILVPYYFFLSRFKKNLRRTFSFQVAKLD